MRLSLQARIWLLSIGVVVGFTLVTLLLVAFLIRREVERTIRRDAKGISIVLTHLMHERLAGMREQSQMIARWTPFKYLIPLETDTFPRETNEPDWSTISDTAESYRADLQADFVFITDRWGKVIGSAGAGADDAEQLKDPGAQQSLHGGAWAGVKVWKGMLLLGVSVPIQVGGYHRGTFNVYDAVDSNTARDLRQTIGSDIAFVCKGKVAGASLAGVHQLPVFHSVAPVLLNINGTRYFALYTPVTGTSPADEAGFVLLKPYDEAMSAFYRLRVALVLVSAATLLLALMVGAAISRGITRPLSGVVEAARLLQQGEWPPRFQVNRSDEIGLLQSVFNDMTEALRTNQERLLALLDIDPLTEIYNHRSFQERLHQEAIRCSGSREPLSLLLIDIDHFAQFNSRHSHAVGDQALRSVAALIRGSVPEIALVARYGGEEFGVLLPQHTAEQAVCLAETIRHNVYAGTQESCAEALTVSIGCAEYGVHSTQPGGLVVAAEIAMSLAKQLGRNRVCRFDNVPGADGETDPYQLHKLLQDGSLATIQALAAAVDAKDAYTQGHSARVAHYACDLARYIGLSEDEIDLIHVTALLHDVGKIGIPDSILKKQAPLDPEERAIMETHPVLGETIVKKAPQLSATLPGVRYHHERWDGKGYPDGLAGESIPFIARILAIADTFDAMTSDRPYRKGLPIEVALQEIQKGAGTQFDPHLAPLFVAMMQESVPLKRAA